MRTHGKRAHRTVCRLTAIALLLCLVRLACECRVCVIAAVFEFFSDLFRPTREIRLKNYLKTRMAFCEISTVHSIITGIGRSCRLCTTNGTAGERGTQGVYG